MLCFGDMGSTQKIGMCWVLLYEKKDKIKYEN